MSDELGGNQLADEHREVGSNGAHAVLEVLSEVRTVIANLDDGLGERLNVHFIVWQDLRTHTDFGGLLNLLGEVFRHDFLELLKRKILDVRTHTNEDDSLSVSTIVRDDLAELREVPRVPFAQSHCIIVQLLVEVLEQADSLNDHSVDLLRRERQFIAGNAMSQTELHLLKLLVLKATSQQRLHLEADATEKLVGFVTCLTGDAKLLLDNLAELLVSDHELLLNILLNDVLLEEFSECFRHVAFKHLLDSFSRLSRIFELFESLQLYNLFSGITSGKSRVKIFDILELAILQDFEECEAAGRLKQYQNHDFLFVFFLSFLN